MIQKRAPKFVPNCSCRFFSLHDFKKATSNHFYEYIYIHISSVGPIIKYKRLKQLTILVSPLFLLFRWWKGKGIKHQTIKIIIKSINRLGEKEKQ